MFVLSPVILMIDATIPGLVITTVTAIIGMIALSSALIGYLADNCLADNCRIYERILLIAGGLLLIDPGTVTDLTGIAIFAIILFFQIERKKKRASMLEA